jgi:hypothetical protein
MALKEIIFLGNLILLSGQSLACDWAMIRKQNNDFIYPAECHREVGRLVEVESKRKEQVEELNKALTLKDLALQKSDERVILWQSESERQLKNLEKMSKNNSLQNSGYFLAGMASVLFGAWAVQKVK